MEKVSSTRDYNQYSLSIRFSSDGFSLSVYDELNKMLSIKKVSALLYSLSEEEIIRMLMHEPELQVNCKNIRLICELDTYAFVPASIFKSDEAELFLFYHDKKEKPEKVLYNELVAWDMVNVFSIPPALHAALIHMYPDLVVEHHLSHFFTDKINQGNNNCLQIWVRPKMMDVVVMTNAKPVLINSFTYRSTEDFVYFTLHVFEQLSLSTDKYEVRLHGMHKLNDLQMNVQKYVKTVVYC
jgi:hypothetical protein